MKEKLFEYICENFSISDKYLVRNILEWILMQSMDTTDTVDALLCIFDGMGITRNELLKFFLDAQTFDEPEEMLKEITDGNDLYNLETGKYVFLYNDRESICVYDLPDDDIKKLSDNSIAFQEYWGSSLGPGGKIYDSEEERAIGESNIEWCKENFNKGTWIYTGDYR